MPRSLLLATLVCLSWFMPSAASQAQGTKRTVAEITADLKKGEKEQLKAIQELEALGEKAADAAPALVALLSAKNEDVRLQATMVLGQIGKPAVEPLEKALASDDAEVRFYAVWGLAFVGPSAKGATPAVLKALEDKSPQVRRKAAFALARIDAEPKVVVNALVNLLGDDNEDVRLAVSEALPKLGKIAVPALIGVLKSDKARLRNTALKTLGDFGSDAEDAIPELKTFLLKGEKDAAESAANALAGIGLKSLPTLTAAADDDNPTVRILAVQAMQKIGVRAVSALVDLFGSKHIDVRRQATTVVGGMPLNDKVVVIGLGFATKDKDFQVRKTALQAIRNRGAGAKLAEPYVSVLLVDIDPEIRKDAFHTLQSLGVDPRPGLKKALSHEDVAVRINTASLMTALNLEVDLAEPILLEGLKQKNSGLKMQAAYSLSLRGLQPDVVLPIFIAGLKDDVASVRRQAAESIARYGDKASKAAPNLIAALDDADDTVRGQAITTLRQIGAEPKSLFAAMVRELRKKESSLHAVAAQIVFQVGPEAIGEVVKLLEKEDSEALRLVCLQTLAMVGPPAKEAVIELTRALKDPAARARMTAARALGNIGPNAKGAVERLGTLEQDADANVRLVAKAALVQIRADANQKDFQVQGVLTPGDPSDRVRTGHYHVVHTYAMKKGQTYTIDLLSTGWDNYLRLENSKGEQLAQDDDSGGNLNARITFQAPQDGWYRIIVTTFAPGASGNYTLKVR